MKTYFGFITLLLCLFVRMVSFAGEEPPNLKIQSSKYVALIDLYSGQKNLDRLLSTKAEIDHMWSVQNSEAYFDLMLAICVRLQSVNFEDNRQCELLQKCVASILDKNIQAPMDIELNSVALLMTPTVPHCKEGSNWASYRRTNSELVLQAWRHLKKAVEQERLPEINVAPPLGANIRPGGAPGEIKDANLRLQYEKELARNRKQTERHNKQLKLDKEYSKKVTDYIVKIYSRPPFHLDELRDLLNKYVSDRATRIKILQAVAEKAVGE